MTSLVCTPSSRRFYLPSEDLIVPCKCHSLLVRLGEQLLHLMNDHVILDCLLHKYPRAELIRAVGAKVFW